jgi:hypothetical protein
LLEEIKDIVKEGEMKDEEVDEDLAISSIIVKTVEKVKFYNKYISSLKKDLQDTCVKYDRIVHKF